jgi:alpha-beta hydrolase superfamily lysophospholipase
MNIIRIATRALVGTFRQMLRALFYGVIGATIVLIILAVLYLDNRPDLKVWHTADLDEEFIHKSKIKNFKEYLALEDRLFAQLNEQVYARIESADQRQINRYHRGSVVDPGRWKTNWNRSYESRVTTPKIGVLLLHGMSDSPYSLLNLGKRLHQEGAWVVGLRIPGHGTAPVGLVDVKWQDMAAAVKLAMRHLQAQVNDAPLYIVGYSNGGALAVQYTLTSLKDETLPMPQGLVLLSPEIGVTKLAALAVWQERLGHLLGMEKLAWNSIQPEYDTFKYGSFALNAGKQAYLLTNEIQQEFSRLGSGEVLQRMPPILAFQSVVDATVTAPALVEGLFDRLPAGTHELTLYDINRYAEIEPILTSNPTAWINTMLHGRELDYTVTLITNQNEESKQVVALSRKPDSKLTTECALDANWPNGVYSLSHVALPFPANDPLYGNIDIEDDTILQLGGVELRGERGVLQISEADLMRLRWNPFYHYQERRILNHLGLGKMPDNNCTE